MSNTDIVREFIAAFNRNDLDQALSFLAPDCFYHNIPFEPVEGSDSIRAVLAPLSAQASKIDWVLRQIAENPDGVVLTERTDRFLIGERWIELPVMGAFELRDGKISSWRDYFDAAQFQSQMSGE